MSIHYPTSKSSLPDLTFTWVDAAGSPINFSSGWVFVMSIGRPPNAAVINKTSGIIGYSGANGQPNLVVTWNVNELSQLTGGRWYFTITATYGPAGGKQRILNGSMVFDAVQL